MLLKLEGILPGFISKRSVNPEPVGMAEMLWIAAERFDEAPTTGETGVMSSAVRSGRYGQVKLILVDSADQPELSYAYTYPW
jgi:hypothetical protein